MLAEIRAALAPLLGSSVPPEPSLNQLVRSMATVTLGLAASTFIGVANTDSMRVSTALVNTNALPLNVPSMRTLAFLNSGCETTNATVLRLPLLPTGSIRISSAR